MDNVFSGAGMTEKSYYFLCNAILLLSIIFTLLIFLLEWPKLILLYWIITGLLWLPRVVVTFIGWIIDFSIEG